MLLGLKVNFDKSCVYGFNVNEVRLREIAGILGCSMGVGPIPYLGKSVGGRRGGLEGWQMVIKKLKKKLWGWNVKTISLGGRATLVQSSLSCIPLYWMSFLSLPKGVEGKLRSLQCSFFWGSDEHSRNMAWIRWEEVCRPKKDGGLGIKNLQLFNSALLYKWVWRFYTESESHVGTYHSFSTWLSVG